jgi:hypothetical protein
VRNAAYHGDIATFSNLLKGPGRVLQEPAYCAYSNDKEAQMISAQGDLLDPGRGVTPCCSGTGEKEKKRQLDTHLYPPLGFFSCVKPAQALEEVQKT